MLLFQLVFFSLRFSYLFGGLYKSERNTVTCSHKNNQQENFERKNSSGKEKNIAIRKYSVVAGIRLKKGQKIGIDVGTNVELKRKEREEMKQPWKI